jgi:hypothetical protein
MCTSGLGFNNSVFPGKPAATVCDDTITQIERRSNAIPAVGCAKSRLPKRSREPAVRAALNSRGKCGFRPPPAASAATQGSALLSKTPARVVALLSGFGIGGRKKNILGGCPTPLRAAAKSGRRSMRGGKTRALFSCSLRSSLAPSALAGACRLRLARQ